MRKLFKFVLVLAPVALVVALSAVLVVGVSAHPVTSGRVGTPAAVAHGSVPHAGLHNAGRNSTEEPG